MQQDYIESSNLEEFKNNVIRAREIGYITNSQETALLLKKMNQELEPDKRISLDVQNRNALRILRNMIVHYPPEKIRGRLIHLLKIPVIKELIAEVDQKGILCYECKNGIIIETTTSTWTSKDEYELILDHVPAKICTNPTCKETMFSSKTMKTESKVLSLVEELISGIMDNKQESLEKETQCPLCEQTMLSSNTTITYKDSISDLFHLKINELPVKTKCHLCGYYEFFEGTKSLLDQLRDTLENRSLKLITIS